MTSDLLRVPITVVRFGDRLATVHAKVDLRFPTPQPPSTKWSSRDR